MQTQEITKLQVNHSTMNLINSIQENNSWQTISCIKLYQERGVVLYKEILKIPIEDRIPALIKKAGEKPIHLLIVKLLSAFCLDFNIPRNMTSEQIIKCAYNIMNSSGEDQLSIEDLVLFFEGAKDGKYGKIYDHIDNQVIFEMMEVYRESRHQEFKNHEDEYFTNIESLGDTNRSSEDTQSIKDLLHNDMINYLITKRDK